MNDAVKEIVSRANMAARSSATMTISSNLTGDYGFTAAGDFNLSAFPLAVDAVAYQGTGSTAVFPMEPITFDEVLEYRRGIVSVTGFVLYYAMNGQSGISTYPTPSAGDKIILYYTAAPADMSADIDTVTSAIPTAYNDLIVLLAGSWSARGLMKHQLADELMAAYEARLPRLFAYRNRFNGSMPLRIRAGHTKRRPYHDRSTYYSGM